MKIAFDQISLKHLPKFYGGEKEFAANMYVDEDHKILRGCLVSGASIGYHRHENSSEIIFVLSGKGRMLYNPTDSGIENAVEETLAAGDCHYCPDGHFHSLINEEEEDLVFFAVVPLKH